MSLHAELHASGVVAPEALEDGGARDPLAAAGIPLETLVRPGSVEEVSRLLAWAAAEGRRVLPLGSGRHLPPWARPPGPAVGIALDRLSGFEHYEPDDLTFTAAAGTPLRDVAERLAEHRQWLPFDPPDVDRRTLGGLVAAAPKSPLEASYGEIRNHVLGATAVLGDGRVVRLGGRVVKNVAGFDLLRPLVGSAGTLGVLTSVCMRVFPLPEVDRLLVLQVEDDDGVAERAAALARSAALPAATVLLAGSAGQEPAGPPHGAAWLLVRLHGAAGAVAAEQAKLERLLDASLRPFSPEDAPQAIDVARDFADVEGAGLGVAHVLPDRLPAALAAVRALRRGRAPLRVSADPFPARIRFAFGCDEVAALPQLRVAIESLGGTLGFERAPGASTPGAASPEVVRNVRSSASVPRDGEAELVRRVRAVYDPAGVLGGGLARMGAA